MIDVSELTYPIILSEIFQNTLPVVDIGFVGQLGKNELASAALATVWFNHGMRPSWLHDRHRHVAFPVLRANRLDNFSAWTANSLVIILPVTAVVSGAVALCGPCMKLFGQDPDLADEASKFSYRLIPGLFPYYLFKIQMKYLQLQNRLAPGAWIGLFANGFNALFNWFLIYGVGWGLMGAPWATLLTRLVEFLLISLYVCANRRSLKDTWPIFSRKLCVIPYSNRSGKLAISGALSFAAETWSFEGVTTILAESIGNRTLGCTHHHIDIRYLHLS
ncbi:hypothetical protein ACHAW5_008241 [Stephanodiscus triporus]|uniref:Polysaccharide biosynthesis protein C-terminal domain-containing protein n=1 Tax=Stephanodiscus triporus TaxID=2934178 RepID=A0ABD3NJ42_9STRA